jgi:uncharacterized protein YjbI with pentapeptide repeats
MGWRDWTGLGTRRWKTAPDEQVQPSKTLWDWLQLLIVPAILVGVTFVWSATQTRSENKRDDRRIAADRAAAEEARQDATLRSYLDQMSGLMLHENLLTSKEGDAVRAVARTVTLATLRRLDAVRKGAVITFLSDARVLAVKNPRVSLDAADLRGANLAGAALEGIKLESSDFRGANLSYAHLKRSMLDLDNFSGANLSGAELSGASLASAVLQGANLRDAYLTQADLSAAYLPRAILVRATLQGANLQNAGLEGADLRGADLRDADLGGAFLKGANLQDADLTNANLDRVENLDLGRLITHMSPLLRKRFLDSHKIFLDSLDPVWLAQFNLTPKKLARIRNDARGR